jgi:hypothetical protein
MQYENILPVCCVGKDDKRSQFLSAVFSDNISPFFSLLGGLAIFKNVTLSAG